MGTTIYTIFLFGLPLLVCIILWRTIMALIKRFWPKASKVENPGCLNLLIFILLGAVFFGMVVLINDNFVTRITVKRNAKGVIVKQRTHTFAPGTKNNAEGAPADSLINDSDIPVYIYSETYGSFNPVYLTTGLPTYTVTCPPGQTIPVMMHIDYYFKRAPQKVKVKSDVDSETRWVLDTIVPYDYVIPVAPNAPIITNPKTDNPE